jgi:hypothetical protein
MIRDLFYCIKLSQCKTLLGYWNSRDFFGYSKTLFGYWNLRVFFFFILKNTFGYWNSRVFQILEFESFYLWIWSLKKNAKLVCL